jgi:hypothetical protein
LNPHALAVWPASNRLGLPMPNLSEHGGGEETRTPLSFRYGGFRDRWATSCPSPPNLERRPGLEPGKGGFAIRRLDLFGIRREKLGGPSPIRTETGHVLSVLPLPVGVMGLGGSGEIRTHYWPFWRRLRFQSRFTPVVLGARFELAAMRLSTAHVYQLRHPSK